MFGFGKSYDDEGLELYEHLVQDWNMRPEYAKAFIVPYKKRAGKILAALNNKFDLMRSSSDPSTRLEAVASDDLRLDSPLVFCAYEAYMRDLRKGNHVGESVEEVIWAILLKRIDILEQHDKAFSIFISEKHEDRFPHLFEKVFDTSSQSPLDRVLNGF